jgi:hypothetical protein
MFFVRFIPTFPVLHRSTFVFRECTQPLLLNAMAIGSLYLGPKDSIAKVGHSMLKQAQSSWLNQVPQGGSLVASRPCRDRNFCKYLVLCLIGTKSNFPTVGDINHPSGPVRPLSGSAISCDCSPSTNLRSTLEGT